MNAKIPNLSTRSSLAATCNYCRSNYLSAFINAATFQNTKGTKRLSGKADGKEYLISLIDTAPLVFRTKELALRVIKSDGTLVFKWSETQVRVSEVLKLAPIPPLFGQLSGRTGMTHWLVFTKNSKN